MNSFNVNQDATTTKGHIPALDGLRGLAILLVLACHLADRMQVNSAITKGIRNIAYGGWTGVDLFFVLSGFLITGILWDTRKAGNYFLNFYARRTLRVFPLYYATVILLLFLVPALAPLTAYAPIQFRGSIQMQTERFAVAGTYWPFYCTYLVDVLAAWKGRDISLSHFWSLSIEEHFYLVWPIVVRWLTLRALIITSITVCIVAMVSRIVAGRLLDPFTVYFLTPFRMDGLALGGLLALLWRLPEHRPVMIRWAGLLMPVAGLIMLLLFCYKGTASTNGLLAQGIGYSASILFYGSLLVKTLVSKQMSSVFKFKFMQLFGKYSYSIYIFHLLPMDFAYPYFALGDPFHRSIVVHAMSFITGSPVLRISKPLLLLDGMVYVLLVVVVSVGIAMVTWRLIEVPCLRLKRFFSYEEKGRPVEGAEIIGSLARG